MDSVTHYVYVASSVQQYNTGALVITAEVCSGDIEGLSALTVIHYPLSKNVYFGIIQ